MTIWLDAQLSPAIATWISTQFAVSAVALRDLGLRDAKDRQIFFAARQASVIVMTKDSDFVSLLEGFGPPPQVIWLTCGNTSNVRLKQILTQTLEKGLERLQTGEPLVENQRGLTSRSAEGYKRLVKGIEYVEPETTPGFFEVFVEGCQFKPMPRELAYEGRSHG